MSDSLQKSKIKDATLEEMNIMKEYKTDCTTKFFGEQNLEIEFHISNYALTVLKESGELSAYINFGSSPHIGSLPKESWLNWIHFHYGFQRITYGNTFFITYLVIADPHKNFLFDAFKEIFLREPKLKYICAVAPPIKTSYNGILEKHCREIYPVDKSIIKTCQTIFICERKNIVPKMRFRRALSEDNDDLVEIIDQKLKSIRIEFGHYYIAEQVIRNDPSETIVVAEISNNPIGMIWLNTHINRKILAENFEIAPYGYFCKNFNLDASKEKKPEMHQYPKPSFTNIMSNDSIKTKPSLISKAQSLSLNNLFIEPLSNDSDSSSNDSKTSLRRSIFKKWEKINQNLRTSHTRTGIIKNKPQIPKITGEPNAFAIQLFGLTSSVDPRRVYDLLASSFSAYPDKDYCILSSPSTDSSFNGQNGQLAKYFSTVVPKAGCKIADFLYVAHRNSFVSELEVSYLSNEDVADIEEILCRTESKMDEIYSVANIMQSFEEYLTLPWSPCDSLVIRSGGCAIGFVVLRQNYKMDELEASFVIENANIIPKWKSGKLIYLYLHPAFIWEWTHIIREICRLTDYWSLFYKLNRTSTRLILNSLLLKMFPILPKNRLDDSSEDSYALYFISNKMCHISRLQLQEKIVLLGFDSTCKGFLRNLIFSSKEIQCPNLTVVTMSDGTIEAEYDKRSFNMEQTMFFHDHNQFTPDYLRKLEFRTWVNFISGNVKDLDGEEKIVKLDNGIVLPYDRLYVMCTARFSPSKKFTTPPTNYMEINIRLDKLTFYHKMQLLRSESIDLPILVYGCVAVAHQCISTMINMGIKPSNICLVTPSNEINSFPEIFDEEKVSNWFYKKEKELGIQIYRNHNFFDWNLYPDEDIIESVLFISEYEKITIKCFAFLNFCTKNVKFKQTLCPDMEVRNNKILIDEYSRTDLPSVYACGRATQYQEYLGATRFEQKYFNLTEIGTQLAIGLIEETLHGVKKNMITVRYVKPLFRQYQLIGNYIYCGLRKPGRHLSRDVRPKNYKFSGEDLVTFNPKEGDYCRIQLDDKGFITEISCFTKRYKNLEILYRLYDLHESYFNNLKLKYENGEIDNLLDYFHRGIFSVILHDEFMSLRKSIRRNNLDCLEPMTKVDEFKILTALKENNMKDKMRDELLKFIKAHASTLCQYYALPEDFTRN